MANKTLKDMFPDVSLDENTDVVPAATKAANKAASELIGFLAENEVKDKRLGFRVSSSTYYQLSTICKKKRVPMTSIFQLLINDFIEENKNLLDE